MTKTDPNDDESSSSNEHKIKELEQEKIFLEEMNTELEKNSDANKSNEKKDNKIFKAESLVESARVTAESLVESARVTAESLKKTNLIHAENIIKTVLNESENIITNAMSEVEAIVDEAIYEVERIIQNAIQENSILKNLKGIEVSNITKSAKIEIEHLRKTAMITSENLQKTARIASENLQNMLDVDSENLQNMLIVTSENLKKASVVESENLQKVIKTEFESLQKTAKVIADNLLESARVTAESLRKAAVVESANLLESARVTAESLRKVARVTAEGLVLSAKVYSSKSITTTHDSIDKNKKINELKNLQLKKKYIIPITVACILLIGISVLYLNQQPKRTELTSEYLIENIKGEKIDTWTTWNLPPGDIFHITVLASPEVTPEKLKIIQDVIFSNQTVTVGNTKYYKGWQGALIDVSKQEHQLTIPLHFDVNEGSSGSGNIVIKLSPLENADGYTGYTKSIADAANHQILKAEITIYNVNNINNDELSIIVRHELGHGFGLGHSDERNDLMFSLIQTTPPYEYISECDVEAMAGLYNGNQKSHVTCIS